MFKRRFRLPSPALVISLVALSLVLGGTAVAASTAKHKDVKADTKLIKKLAPTLSVKHAKTANSATTAGSATSATHATSADSATNATHATSADSATNATNATNASALGGVAASGYVQNGGNIYVGLGYTDWIQRESADPLDVTYYSDTAGFARTAIGSSYIVMVATLPTSLYGRALSFTGFQVCYSANASASISSVLVYKVVQTSTGQGGTTIVANDSTTRTDAACRTYNPSSPVTLTSSTLVELYVLGNWTSGGANLFLGRVTAVLTPTSTAGTLSKGTARAGNTSGHSDTNASH